MGPNLRLWPVLHHLTDDKERSDIVHLVIYGDSEFSGYGTALYVTTDGSVYAAGVNSYAGRYSKRTEIIKDGGNFLLGSVKVEFLSSLGLKKIVQSCGFGAGLTVDNEIYLWGDSLSYLMLGEEFIILYECFTPGTPCKKCASHTYSPYSIGGYTISKCEACMWCPSYDLDSTISPETEVKAFVAYCDVVEVLCSSCRQSCSFLRVGDYDMFYCTTCNLLQESIGWCDESSTPLRLRHSLRIVDVACGLGFLLVVTASNELVVWGELGCQLQGHLNNPDNVVIQRASCGSSHLAVITDRNALYTCGVGSSGQLGYEWNVTMGFTTLRKVTLPGAGVKVCCGSTSTVCLMADGSVAYFGHSRTGSPRITTIKQYIFTDIASATLTDFFCAKTTKSQVFFFCPKSTPKLYLKVDAHDCLDALVGRPASYDRTLPEIVFIKQNNCEKHGFSHYAEFYGRELHSDLILKLKDGDISAHRLVLYNNSAYYKNLFSESPINGVVDMSSHDPYAYRNLLKYFYQTLVEELDWRQLLSLHVLAISHNEVEIVKDTFEKLQRKLNKENIEEVARAAKSSGLSDLEEVCLNRDQTAGSVTIQS